MVVGSGNGTYDVLRWDGTCSRGVEAEMLVRARPARPRSAHVQWHRIGSALQDALIAGSEPVKRAHAKRGKECQGASSGDVSKSCEAADQALVDAIVDAGANARRCPRAGHVAVGTDQSGLGSMQALGASDQAPRASGQAPRASGQALLGARQVVLGSSRAFGVSSQPLLSTWQVVLAT